MKSTEHFKNTIKAYLDRRAHDDLLFAVTYAKPQKNMDDCITYILNEVHKGGCNGFADEEIYSMAIHYYDEDGITAVQPLNCRVVVNHTVELTAEEKEEARQEAMKWATNEAYNKMIQPKKSANKPAIGNTDAPNLFNF
ncbi:MAG: PcfK-like family protein [Bacteroidales bacterium]|nr:PcfK-like family protein [Bacteroidales bacterium]